jgi:Holliday junction resolvasome RuvABC DNA-binding subunit
VLANYRAGQQAIYNDLYSVLRREKKETFMTLMNVYGFGSVVPSPFALDLLSRLDLHEACPYLQESERQLKDLTPDHFKAPRQEIQAAIASLNCK